MIDVIAPDTFPESHLNEATETMLQAFRVHVLPSYPIERDHYYDIMSLLLAAY